MVTGANVNAKRPSNIDDDRKPADRLLSTKEAATLLGLSPSTLHTWRSTGHVRLPHVRLGRAVRYPERGLLDYLARTATS
ncbi:MAG: helix-turn-helix domain-containing protein [Candidatus Binatia bacterium]